MNSQDTDQMANLFTGLRDPVKEHRARCVQEIVAHGDKIIPGLISLLKDSEWRVRYRAAEALGMMQAIQAVPDLIETCSDEKDHVRYMAAKSLGSIRTPDAIPVLTRLLSDEHPYTRGIAAEALGFVGDSLAKTGIRSAMERETDPKIRDRMKKSLDAW